MAADRRVYDSRHLQADCQEPGSALLNPALGNRVWATFLPFTGIRDLIDGQQHPFCQQSANG